MARCDLVRVTDVCPRLATLNERARLASEDEVVVPLASAFATLVSRSSGDTLATPDHAGTLAA